jgi:hypothetical protein
MMFLLVGLQRIPTEGRSIAMGMTLPDGSTAEGVFSPLFLSAGPAPVRFHARKPPPRASDLSDHHRHPGLGVSWSSHAMGA